MRVLHIPAPLERFTAVPHQFQPRLSLYGAFVFIAAALARVFIGSLIAALWGVEIWMAVDSKHSTMWKTVVISGLAIGLVVSIAAVMWAIGKATMKLEACGTSSSAPPVT